MGAAWLSTHLFEHYSFGGDPAFLRRAYPVLKEAAEFLLDFLVEDEQGRLVTNPSHSPENAFIDAKGNEGVLCVGATMDFGIIRELFGDCLRAAEILGEDAAFRGRLQSALDRLPPYQIGKHGQLQEWLQDFDEAEPGHRHVSHLFGLHPGHSITLRGTPELARAARVALERRLANGGGGTGWSRAWVVNFFARLGDGDKAGENLDDAAREVDPAEPVRQPPAVPDRRQLRRHRRHRGDAAAEPRGRAGPAAGAPARVAGRPCHGPSRARRLRGRPRLEARRPRARGGALPPG